MTLHRRVIETLRNQFGEAINNHYAPSGSKFRLGNLTPDIVVKKKGRVCELHEVECTGARGLPKQKDVKRVLWLTINGEWDEINAINNEVYKLKIRPLEFEYGHLEYKLNRLQKEFKQKGEKLKRKIEIAENKLSRLNKKVGERLSELKELKRQIERDLANAFMYEKINKAKVDWYKSHSEEYDWR